MNSLVHQVQTAVDNLVAGDARSAATMFHNRVYLGDCQQVMRQMPDQSVDMVLTDPPYLVRYKDRQGHTVANDDNDRWMFPAFAEMYRLMKEHSFAVSFYGWGKADRFLSIWRECGFSVVGHFVWVKRYASGTRFTRMMHEQAYLLAKGSPRAPQFPPSDVRDWKYTGNRLHPTQKPVGALVPLIQAYSRPGAIVLDPFAGSGSTGVAARACDRQYVLIERDAAHLRVAADRMARCDIARA